MDFTPQNLDALRKARNTARINDLAEEAIEEIKGRLMDASDGTIKLGFFDSYCETLYNRAGWEGFNPVIEYFIQHGWYVEKHNVRPGLNGLLIKPAEGAIL